MNEARGLRIVDHVCNSNRGVLSPFGLSMHSRLAEYELAHSRAMLSVGGFGGLFVKNDKVQRKA